MERVLEILKENQEEVEKELRCARCGVPLNNLTGINLFVNEFYCDDCIEKEVKKG